MQRAFERERVIVDARAERYATIRYQDIYYV